MLDTILENKEFIFSVVTGITSIVALYISGRQIKISNKQNLFNKRLDNYIIFKDVLDCYCKNQDKLKNGFDKIKFNSNSISMHMIAITNCRSLEGITEITAGPFDMSCRKLFINNLEAIDRIATEELFIFPDKEAKIMKNFLCKYTNLLMNLYAYLAASIIKENPGSRDFAMNLTHMCMNLNEDNIRRNLKYSYDELNKAFEEIEKANVDKKLKEIIKL